MAPCSEDRLVIRADAPPRLLVSRAETGPRSPARTDRIVWPDIARGIGIVLVVIGHALGGMLAGGQIASGSALDLVFFTIYSFHMPLFFVLSGMFVPDSLSRGRPGFVRTALRRIAYPYFVWGFIQLATIVALGQMVNAPQQASPMLFVSMIWSPPSQYWFLYALFAFQIATVLFDRYANVTVMLWVALAARLLPEFLELPDIVQASLRNWLYFAFAVRFASLIRDSAAGHRTTGGALAALAVAWIAAVFLSGWGGGYLSPWNLPAAVLGTWLVFRIAQLPGLPGAGLLAALGRRSMPIFLTHVLIVAGIRIVSVSVLKIADPYLILPVAVLAGLAIPVVLFDWADRRRLATVLALR